MTNVCYVLRCSFDVFFRGLVGGKYSTLSSTSHGGKEKFSEDAVISHTKLVSPGSLENLDVGKIIYLFILLFIFCF